jgi:hypothetical protein
MNDPFEDQLRSTLRQVAQQTTTTHDLGVPASSPRPSRSRRLVVTSALSVLALVGGGVFFATRGDGGTQTVQAAAGEATTSAPETTVPSIGAALANVCSNASGVTLPPRLSDAQSAIQSMLGKVCSGGGLAAMNPLAACGVDAGAIRDLLAPLMTDLGPQLDQLKAIVTEFEPRIRAITDDPATKAKLDAVGATLRDRLEGLADPATRPDFTDPAVRQQLLDELKADLAPLETDAAVKAKVDALASDLRARLEAFAASPDGQALQDKLKAFAASPTLQDQAKALGDKIAACLPH